MGLNHIVRYVLVALVLVVLASTGWRHRNDTWVRGLLRPQGPAKTTIEFDNGSVRDTLPRVADDAADRNNLPGQLKKCVRKSQVVYTDQPCPAGFSVALVSDGKVSILQSTSPPAGSAKAPSQDARKTLHDALDLTGNDNIKDKMMERAINR